MRTYVVIESLYAYLGELPDGCKLCIRGAKAVIFVTGLCKENCFYCPVSPRKIGKDVMFVNEERVKKLDDVILELERIEAEGASLTGGEPLLKLDRVLKIVSMLKREFGDRFHIHMYTIGKGLDKHVIELLESSGLDELRIHARDETWFSLLRNVVEYRSTLKLGVEIPIFPNSVEYVKKLIKLLDMIGFDFINLNEVEVAPHKLEEFRLRGYHVKGYTVVGSLEAGLQVIDWASRNTKRLNIHLCSARFKDAIQHRNRLLRKALGIRHYFEEVSNKGTLEVIEVHPCKGLNNLVEEGYGIKRDDTCFFPPSSLDIIKTWLRGGVNAYLLEYMPTVKRKLLSRSPLRL